MLSALGSCLDVRVQLLLTFSDIKMTHLCSHVTVFVIKALLGICLLFKVLSAFDGSAL